MEGVVDFVIRDVYSDLGGVDQFVTEFIRVTKHLHPKLIFHRYAPELFTGSRTRTGIPVFIQLLGGDPSAMADNAARAAELGAIGIDLNFGCPAKLVNRHDGGAVLLKSPDRVFSIVSAVRAAVPKHIPVTSKMRLGFEDTTLHLENSKACEEGGSQWLTVHCRTKKDGYKPPAYWEFVPRIREHLKIPIIANGEVWSVDDYIRCREVTGSADVMIGRGAMSNPYLFRAIKDYQQHQNPSQIQNPLEKWSEVRSRLPLFFEAASSFKSPWFAQARTKQWLRQLSLKFPEAKPVFDELKVITNPQVFREKVRRT